MVLFVGDRISCISGWVLICYVVEEDLEVRILLPLPLNTKIIGMGVIPSFLVLII